jgi:diguanylate cyclase
LQEIKREKEKIQTIVQGIGDAVFVVDKEKRLTTFNKKAEELSGFSFDEAINRPYKEVLNFIFEKDGKVNDKFINQAFSTGEVQEMSNHTMLVRKNGSKLAVDDSAAPIKDSNGNTIGCVVVFRDVGREREIDKMKSEFVSVASHQLKTPLAGIK